MNNLLCFKDLKVGDAFLDVLSCGGRGLKLSEYRYFSFDKNKVYGFMDNKKNDSDNAHYIKCDIEVTTHDT